MRLITCTGGDKAAVVVLGRPQTLMRRRAVSCAGEFDTGADCANRGCGGASSSRQLLYLYHHEQLV